MWPFDVATLRLCGKFTVGIAVTVETFVASVTVMAPVTAPLTLTVPLPPILSLPEDRKPLIAAAEPWMLTVVPVPSPKSEASAELETLSALSAFQTRTALPEAAKVSVTGSAVTRACDPIGMATAAPSGVVTFAGKLSVAGATAPVGPT